MFLVVSSASAGGQLDRGQPLRVAHLFEGFQAAHFVPLLVIGAIDIALTLLLTLAFRPAGLLGR